MDKNHFDAVVIGGGGNKGIIALGILKYYEEEGRFDVKKLKEFAGTSIGAVVCLLLNCGYTPQEIFNDIYQSSFMDVNFSLSSIPKEFGLASIQSFLEKVGEMVKKKMGSIPTLGELHSSTSQILHISRSNISTKQEDILNYKTQPTLSCVDAVGQSCNLPFLFHRWKSSENHWVADGALVNNYPWDYISSDRKDILGIYLGGHRELGEVIPENSIFWYAWNVATLSMSNLSKLRLKIAPSSVTTVTAEWNGDFVKMNLTKDEKMKMYVHGWQCGERKNNSVVL